MSSKYDELIEKLESGDIPTSSVLMLKDESKQEKTFLKGIPRLQKKDKLKSKLLFPLEIAVPFDPITGEVTEQYNEGRKFRPPLSATSTAILLKKFASRNEKTKQMFEKRAGMEVGSWDVSEPEVLTETDKNVFRHYRVPRIFTVPVIGINNQLVTGRDYSVDYILEVDRNPLTGEVEGEMPLVLQVNKFFRDKIFEEVNHIRDCVDKAQRGEDYVLKSTLKELKMFDLATITEEDLRKKVLSEVYKSSMVGEDRPLNSYVVYELPLTNTQELEDPAQYKTLTKQDMSKFERIVKSGKEIRLALEKFREGSTKADVHYDFWEIDMICPSQSADAMELGLNTRYQTPENRLKDEKFYQTIVNVFIECMDDTATLEQRFLKSSRLRKFDQSVENKLIDALAESNVLEDPFVTEKVLQYNADLVSLVFGDKGDQLLMEIDSGLSDKESGHLDEEEAAKLAKMNVADLLQEETSEGDEIGVEEIELE